MNAVVVPSLPSLMELADEEMPDDLFHVWYLAAMHKLALEAIQTGRARRQLTTGGGR